VLDRRKDGLDNDLTVTEPDTAEPNLHLVIDAVAGDLEVSRP
jgi:hypothetical protein